MSNNKRFSWDLGRFWQTLTYFEIIPFINCWSKLFGSRQVKHDVNLKTKMKILVVGAISDVGKKIVRRLLAEDYDVIALVRDTESGKSIFSNTVEFVEINLTSSEVLKPETISGVSAVICCDTTALEAQNFQHLIELVSQNLQPDNHKVLFDFTNPTNDIKETWGAVDDVVMGGVSQSQIRLTDNRAIFSGIVSTDNNGGFASVRTRNFQKPLDLSDYQGIQLRVKGDGKRYKFILRCEGKWDGISYCYSFDTVYDFPLTISIPFQDFIPVFRAKTLADVDPLDASKVYSLQLMLSKFEYDGTLNSKFEAGSFGIEIESIQTYSKIPKSQFVLVSLSNQTNIESPELLVQNSDLKYTILRSDNLASQVNQDIIAKVSVQALRLPEAVNKTIAVREEYNLDNIDWKKIFSD